MKHESFADLFQHAPVVSTKAHGRVNLIGEHTDYNGGFVLPMLIPQMTRVQLSPRTDRKVCAISGKFKSKNKFEYELGREKKNNDWTDYLQGVTSVLLKTAAKLNGFNVLIDSSVPMGSGLSSSAAFEVGLLRGLNEIFSLGLDGLKMAQLGQQVENQFVGAQVGIMDQMASSLGQENSALFIDTRDLKYEQVPLPKDFALAVINSGVSHSHADGDYNSRRQECEQACASLKVAQLRDLTVEDLPKLSTLSPVIAARARHVITENHRVLNALAALKSGDLNTLGQLFIESHQSMRDDYQVSVSEVDLLVELALNQKGVFGARLTGGGFGGSVIVLAQKEQLHSVTEAMLRQYREKTGRTATVLMPSQESELRQ